MLKLLKYVFHVLHSCWTSQFIFFAFSKARVTVGSNTGLIFCVSLKFSAEIYLIGKNLIQDPIKKNPKTKPGIEHGALVSICQKNN